MQHIADAVEAWRSHTGERSTEGAALAFDYSARSIDQDGHMYVTNCLLTKGVVNPYKGSEIPDYKALGLKANEIYQLYRDPKELEKGVATLQGKPLLLDHQPISADDHPNRIVVGTIMNPFFADGEIHGDLVVWKKDAIDEIEDGSKRELSCGYRYKPIMQAGQTPGGEQYDGRMTEIQFNHVALVAEGRVSGAIVADSAVELVWLKLGKLISEAFSVGSEDEQWVALSLALDAWNEQAHPRGGNPGNKGQFSKGSGGGAAPAPARSSRRRSGTPRAELIRQAQTFGMSFHRASHKRVAVLEKAVALLRGEAAPRAEAPSIPVATQAPSVTRATPAPQRESEQRPSTQSRASKKELLKSLLEKTGKNPLKKLKEKGFEPTKKSVYYMDKVELQKALEHLEKKDGKSERATPPAPAAPRLTPIQEKVQKAFEKKVTDLKPADFDGYLGAGERTNRSFPALAQKRKLAALFNTYIKINPGYFTDCMTHGLNARTILSPSQYGETLAVVGSFGIGGSMTRRFNFANKSVEHSYLQMPSGQQGGGTAKKLFQSQVETYKQLGLEKVGVHANIDVGSYCWAKYGFIPRQDSWDQFRGEMKSKLERLSAVHSDTKERVKLILNSSDPKAIWALSDLPDTHMSNGEKKSVAKSLMMNEHWYADLNLKNEDAMKRFNNYVNR